MIRKANRYAESKDPYTLHIVAAVAGSSLDEPQLAMTISRGGPGMPYTVPKLTDYTEGVIRPVCVGTA